MELLAPLSELGTLALVLWAIATALAIAVLMGYIAGALRGLPWPINLLAGPVEALAQGISNVCGKLEHGIDKLIGASWHALARYIDHLWNNTVSQAHLLLLSAETALGLTHAHVKLKGNVHHLTTAHSGDVARIKRLEKEYKGIEHGIKQLEVEFRGIDEIGIRKRLGHLQKEIDAVRGQTIPALRERVAADEGAFAGLEKWLGIETGVNYKAWAIGLATTLLGAIGLGGLRCNSLSNNLDKRGCSMWGAMDDLLGLLALGIAAGEFDNLVHEAQGLTHIATTVFDDVFGLDRP